MSVVAIGECGLDYSIKNTVDKETQKKVFYNQLKLGLKYNLPLVLHIRDAEEDGYQVLEAAGVPADYQIHRHCFTGGWPAACTWMDKFPASWLCHLQGFSPDTSGCQADPSKQAPARD